MSKEDIDKLALYLEQRRIEDTWRRDRWITWIGALTGLVGAAAALLAVILK